DHAMEREVFERVILGVHRETALAGLERRPLRHGERHEHAAELQAHVPVEARGMVTVHYVPPGLRLLRWLPLWFGRALEVAFALVLGEAHALLDPIVLEAGEGAPFSRPKEEFDVVVLFFGRHVPQGGVRRLADAGVQPRADPIRRAAR